MAWTSPTPVTPSQLVTEAFWNAQITENLKALAERRYSVVRYTNGSNYTISGSTWTDVDAANISGSITNASSTRIKFTVQLNGARSAGVYVAFDLLVDGARIGDATYGIGQLTNASGASCSFTAIKTGLSVGAHTFKLQFKCDAGGSSGVVTGTLPVMIIAEEF